MEELTAFYSAASLIKKISLIVFLTSCLTVFASLLSGAILLVLIPFNAVPGSIKGGLAANPLNIVFFGELLTPLGKRLRTWLIRLLFVLCSAMILGIVSSAIITSN